MGNGMMRVMVMPHIREMIMEEREIPPLQPDEALVRIRHVGICGSDVHYYEDGRIGDFVVEKPIVLGHECAGEIAAIGSAVKTLAIGDRVTVEPGKPCGRCRYCMEGRYNLCPDMVFMATPPVDGSMAEYIAYPAHLCFKLPDNMSTEEGALVDPVAVAYHTTFQAGAAPGKSAIVLGSGTIGVATMMALRSAGVSKVFMTDAIPNRLRIAKDLGADEALLADETADIGNVFRALGDEGFDIVVESAGSDKALLQSADLVKRGGTIAVVGMTVQSENTIKTTTLLSKEATLKTVFRYRNLWPVSINAIASGNFPVRKIISGSYPFEESKAAFERCIVDKENVLKIMLEL
ncbi:MAG: NAD(P)-dependent alcohol dehydrogenase [Clostridiales Family XIII bacterium]|nr:NAD(P)-dependent alcohol dehydrogenase [Clostridiales Family XIII bacterium]